MKMSNKSILLSSTLSLGLIMAMAAPSYAQTSSGDDFANAETLGGNSQFSDDTGVASGDVVTVTGSRIRRTDLNTAFPTLVLDTDVLDKNAFTNLADALGQIPAFGTGTTPNGGQGANIGTNFVDFLGLGSQRTLTLVNGHRFVSANAAGTGAQVDFGVIPIGLVERIETIGVGGAPTYGTDAIAGTINVILKEDYEGFEATALYGESDSGDNDEEQYSFLLGANSPDGKGNVTFNAEYTRNAGLDQIDRPEIYINEARAELVQAGSALFDDVPLPAGADPEQFDQDGDGFLDSVNRIINPNGESVNIQLFTDGGVISPGATFIPSFGIGSFGGDFFQFDTAGNLVDLEPGITPPSGAFRSIGGFENDFFVNTTQITSPIERFNFGSSFNYKINDLFKFKGDFQYNNTVAIELANQGGFQTFAFGGTSGPIQFTPSNPFLTDQAVDVLTNTIGLGPDDTVFLSRFNNDLLDGGERRRESSLWRISGGFEGDFDIGDRNFYWDVNAVAGQSDIETTTLLLNNNRFLNAIDAVIDPATGEIACAVTVADEDDLVGSGLSEQSSDVSACVPLNLFGDGVASPEAIDFVQQRGVQLDDIQQSVFTANFGGEIIDLPAGPLQFSVGYEARKDSALFATDGATEVGLGRGAAQTDTGGSVTVNEYYGELLLPIANSELNIPFVDTLEVGGQVRRTDNSQAGNFTSYTVEGTYKPVQDFTLRGNYTESFRAPSLVELFQGITTSFQFADDPCDARFLANNPNRAANCASIGITQPFESFVVGATTQGLTGGNPDLTFEVANSYTIGGVLQPRWVPNLTLQADYINIDIEDRIGAQTLENNLETCFDADPANFPNFACATFTRDAGGQVVDFQSGQLNADAAENQFLNFRGDYRFDVADLLDNFGGDGGDAGSFAIAASIFHVIQRDLTIAGVEQDNTIGGFFDPKWSGTGDFTYTNDALRVFWRTIWQNRALLSASGNNFFADPEGNIVRTTSSNFLHNASVSFDVSSLVDSYDNPLIVQFNVNNVFDDDPGNGIRRAFGDFFQDEIIGRNYSLRVRAVF